MEDEKFIEDNEIIEVQLEQDECQQILVNGTLLINISRCDVGFSTDFYKPSTETEDEVLLQEVAIYDDDLEDEDDEDFEDEEE